MMVSRSTACISACRTRTSSNGFFTVSTPMMKAADGVWVETLSLLLFLSRS